MRRIALLDRRGLGALALAYATAACASARPRWIEHTPRGYAYEYVVGLGSDSSRVAAREAAIASAMARIVENGEIRLSVSRTDTISREERLEESARGAVRRAQGYHGTLAVSARTPALTAHGLRVVDEFWEPSRAGTDFWVLVRHARPGGGQPPPGPLSLALRSAVLPGWGQMTKQQPRRGAAILGTIAAAIPAAMVLDAMRSDAALRARRAQTAAVRTYWRDRANTLGSARAGALSIGGATYVYGIVDAAARRLRDR